MKRRVIDGGVEVGKGKVERKKRRPRGRKLLS